MSKIFNNIGCDQKNNLIAFPYFGGKSYIATWIIDHFPKHDIFVDVFGGAGNIILQKKEIPFEVYNDLNYMIVNFFEVLRIQPVEFERFVELIPYSRSEFYKYDEIIRNRPSELTDFEKACWFWAIARMSFNGRSSNWSYSMSKSISNSKSKSISKLYLVANRFRNVYIENRDFQIIFKNYDNPETLFYCDPPYISSDRKGKNDYTHEMTEDQHKILLQNCINCKGMVIISGYDNTLYNDMLRDWDKDEIEVAKYSKGITKTSKELIKPRVKEIIWIKPNCRYKKELTLF
jgi:DNA adenine methylase